MRRVFAVAVAVLGVVIGVLGTYAGEIDDSPGLGGLSLILMGLLLWLSVRLFRSG